MGQFSMIISRNPGSPLSANQHGKYILRKLHYHWFSYGKAGIVTGRSRNILHLEREEMMFSERWGRVAYTGNGRRFPGGSCPLSMVACVCDTCDDVNAVLQLDLEAKVQFHDLVAKAAAKIHTLAQVSTEAAGTEI